MTEPEVQLHTSKLTLLAVGYAVIVRPPVVAGVYPVTAFIDPLAVKLITSVVATPVAVAELTEPAVTVWHDAVEMELVARAKDPEAITLAAAVHVLVAVQNFQTKLLVLKNRSLPAVHDPGSLVPVWNAGLELISAAAVVEPLAEGAY